MDGNFQPTASEQRRVAGLCVSGLEVESPALALMAGPCNLIGDPGSGHTLSRSQIPGPQKPWEAVNVCRSSH